MRFQHFPSFCLWRSGPREGHRGSALPALPPRVAGRGTLRGAALRGGGAAWAVGAGLGGAAHPGGTVFDRKAGEDETKGGGRGCKTDSWCIRLAGSNKKVVGIEGNGKLPRENGTTKGVLGTLMFIAGKPDA